MFRKRNSGLGKRRLLLESLEYRRVFDATLAAEVAPSVEAIDGESAVVILPEKPIDIEAFVVESRPDDANQAGSEATPLPWIGNGMWIDGVLETNTDADAFQVNLPGLIGLSISLGTDTETSAAEWQLLDADNQVVTGESDEFGVHYRNLSAGNYFLVVSSTTASENPVHYWLSGYGTRVDDSSSLDETATVMSLDWGIGGTFDGENDVDAFQVKLPETDGLTIYGSHDELVSNFAVRLYQADGTEIAPAPPVEGQDASFSQYDALAGGLYYVVVEGSAAAKSEYWISLGLGRPEITHWIRGGTGMEELATPEDGSVEELMVVTTVTKDDETVIVDEVVVDEVVVKDGDVEVRDAVGDGVDDDVVPVEEGVNPEIHYTVGGPTDEILTTTSIDPMDTNGDGIVSALDALVIINHLASQARSGGSVAASATSENESIADAYDINGNGQVTAADLLMVINRLHLQHNEYSEGTSDESPIAVDEPFDVSDDGVKELALADVGPYGVVYLHIDSDGLLKAEADSVAVDVAVATDGSLYIGEDLLPAHLVTSSTGEALLASGFVSAGGPDGIAIPHIDHQALLEAALESAQSLALADVGNYGVVYLELVEGALVVTTDSEVVNATVDESGKIYIGELQLPAILYTSVSGAQGIFSADDPLLNPEPIDELPIDGGRFAGYLTLNLISPTQTIVLSVNEEDGSVSAVADGQTLEVEIGEDGSITIGGDVVPVIVRDFADTVLLVPTGEESDYTVDLWANEVDEVMAELA
jgi:Dockerin type I domain